MAETDLPQEASLLGDCKTLCVGGIRFPAGSRRAYQSFGGAAALLFQRGDGTIRISGSARKVCAGMVELVCLGETCEVVATSEIYAYIVIAKENKHAHERA